MQHGHLDGVVKGVGQEPALDLRRVVDPIHGDQHATNLCRHLFDDQRRAGGMAGDPVRDAADSEFSLFAAEFARAGDDQVGRLHLRRVDDHARCVPQFAYLLDHEIQFRGDGFRRLRQEFLTRVQQGAQLFRSRASTSGSGSRILRKPVVDRMHQRELNRGVESSDGLYQLECRIRSIDCHDDTHTLLLSQTPLTVMAR